MTLATVASLEGIATGNPEHKLTQETVFNVCRDAFSSRSRLFDAISPIYTNAEIETRYLAMPIEWFKEPCGVRGRMEQFEAAASDLATDVARQALESASMSPSEIGGLVTVSSTGVSVPAFDVSLMNSLDFRSDVTRMPLFSCGCAGGITGLSQAARLCQQSQKPVLFVAIEFCSLAYRLDKLTKANMVTTALFGDGCAAVVLRPTPTDQSKGIVGQAGEYLWKDTRHITTKTIDSEGLECSLHKQLPNFIRENLPDALGSFLNSTGKKISDYSRLCLHPGGPKVLQAMEKTMGLEPGTLDVEREVLRDYANMSSPTVLFVLQKLIKNLQKGPILAGALGPGFTAGFMEIELSGNAEGVMAV